MNISCSEILLILLVALLVIKPERLPHVASILGRGFKWFQMMIHQIKKEIAVTFDVEKKIE